jgi:hypothetical protein
VVDVDGAVEILFKVVAVAVVFCVIALITLVIAIMAMLMLLSMLLLGAVLLFTFLLLFFAEAIDVTLFNASVEIFFLRWLLL